MNLLSGAPDGGRVFGVLVAAAWAVSGVLLGIGWAARQLRQRARKAPAVQGGND